MCGGGGQCAGGGGQCVGGGGQCVGGHSIYPVGLRLDTRFWCKSSHLLVHNPTIMCSWRRRKG